MNTENPKHMLARIVMDAVVAGSNLSSSDQTSLAKEMTLAAEQRYQDRFGSPWDTVSGGLRSGS